MAFMLPLFRLFKYLLWILGYKFSIEIEMYISHSGLYSGLVRIDTSVTSLVLFYILWYYGHLWVLIIFFIQSLRESLSPHSLLWSHHDPSCIRVHRGLLSSCCHPTGKWRLVWVSEQLCLILLFMLHLLWVHSLLMRGHILLFLPQGFN